MSSARTAVPTRLTVRSRPVRRRRRPSGRVLAAVAAAIVVITGLVWLIFFSTVLAVRTVEVSGGRTVPADVVRQLAAVPVGVPMARLDVRAVQARVATIPQVASVSVERSWPSTLRIRLVERAPVALVSSGGEQWLVDREGVLYAQVTEPPAGVPPLEVDRPGPDDPTTVAALAVIRALPKELRAQLTGVSAQSPDSVVLQLRDGRTVVWGGAEDSARKATILTALLGQEGTTFDVSTPSAVVIR